MAPGPADERFDRHVQASLTELDTADGDTAQLQDLLHRLIDALTINPIAAGAPATAERVYRR